MIVFYSSSHVMKAVYLVKQDSDAYQLAGSRLDCVT